MSFEWPLPETATAEDIREALENVIDTLGEIAATAEISDESLAEVESVYIARKAIRDARRTELDRALYKVEVLQTRLNDIGG